MPAFALIDLSSNDDYKDSREGFPDAVRAEAPHPNLPDTDRGWRGFCSASYGEGERPAVGFLPEAWTLQGMDVSSYNAFKPLRPAEAPPPSLADFPQKALERQGGFAGQKDLGLTMWLPSQVADATICEETAHAQDLLALTLVTLEQVAQDGGKWELGYLLSLQQDPPAWVFQPRLRLD